MTKIYDFSQYKVNKYRFYGGRMGKKECIMIDDKPFMLKYAPHLNLSKGTGPYRNDPFSEYIGCHIYKMAGIPVQNTLIGKKNGVCCVACEDFEKNGYKLSPFLLFRNGCINAPGSPTDTEIDTILETIHKQEVFKPIDIEKRFWEMVVMDAFIANPDRHNENWGFLINEEKLDIQLSPVYDCGYSLFSQELTSKYERFMSDPRTISKITNGFPPSLIKKNGEEVNFKTLLLSGEYKGLDAVILELVPKIDLDKIFKMIQDISILEPIQKEFYCKILKGRYTNIMLPALELAKDRNKGMFNTIRLFSKNKDKSIPVTGAKTLSNQEKGDE